MADFLTAHARTAQFEGGYQCDEDDNGNWTGSKKGLGLLIGTNFGIAAPVLAAFLGREPSKQEMKNLSPDTAAAIYRRNYWTPIKGDEIRSQAVANELYDMAVNAGVGRAIVLACQTAGLPASTIMTSAILKAMNA